MKLNEKKISDFFKIINEKKIKSVFQKNLTFGESTNVNYLSLISTLTFSTLLLLIVKKIQKYSTTLTTNFFK